MKQLDLVVLTIGSSIASGIFYDKAQYGVAGACGFATALLLAITIVRYLNRE